MKYRMRMLAKHRYQLRQLLGDTTREQACFLVCGTAQGRDEKIILVREVLALEPGDLLIHAPDQLSVNPDAMLRVARRAKKLNGSICMVHTHPMCHGEVEFSRADDYGNIRTFEFFSCMLPGQINSCLVWDAPLECVAGRAYESVQSWKKISAIEVVSGECRSVHHERKHQRFEIGQIFDRQARLLGKEGQHHLSTLRVVIVGCGGIGSVASSLLVHSGIRHITLIDFDKADVTNLPRLLGSNPMDVQNGRNKADIARRYIQDHVPDVEVIVLNHPVEEPSIVSHLVSADLIVSCTDNTTSRAYINQLCHQYFVPVLDLGVQFGADVESGKLVKEVGRVNLMLPGSACMCCTGHIDPQRLALESLSREDQEKRRAEGYVIGSDVEEPSMMAFNMQVAARGIQLCTQWITGLKPIDTTAYEAFRFIGLNGEPGMKPVRKRSDSQCLFCGVNSSLLGVGNLASMLVKPRFHAVA
ncbi:MAG TPA: ThiF family adenylyltransferase [Paucimonas sp.]|nr:ThiF family adenylyltransferase [Paucimonas sp.]